MSAESLSQFRRVWPLFSPEESEPGIDTRPELSEGFECRTGQCGQVSQNCGFTVEIINGKLVYIDPTELGDDDGYDLGDPILR